MKKKIIVIGALLLVIIVVAVKLIANYTKIQEKKAVKNTRYTSVSVTTERVVKKEVTKNLQVVGTTIAKSEVVLQAEIAAQVATVEFSLGDRVRKGQLLVRLDDRTQTYALENAKLNLFRLEDEYKRVKSIFDGKAGTETQLRDSKMAYENARIGVEQAKRQLEFTRITAPFDGVVFQKSVERGGFVGVGAQMLSIVDINQLKIAINVSELDAYRLKIAQAAQISSSVFPGISFNGKVTFISPKADKWHNYMVEVQLENQSAHQLRSGTFVTVGFDFGSAAKKLVIPRKALQGSMKDAAVFVVEQGIASLRKVTIGQDYGDYLEILGGLSENEEIVTTGQLNLTDGITVTAVK